MAGTAPLDVGALAPDFELPDQNGLSVGLSDLLADGPLVLFFYPAAMSPGCTAESCHFRDLTSEFAELGARVVGISRDRPDRQRQFDESHGLGYPLLADVDGAVAVAYGVVRGRGRLLPLRRSTFVIEADRRILATVHSELHMDVHADRALEALRRGRGAVP